MNLTKAKIYLVLECGECQGSVYLCDKCGDYFYPIMDAFDKFDEDKNFVYCDDGKHYCEECAKDLEEK